MVSFWLDVLRRAFWDSIYAVGQSKETIAFYVVTLVVGLGIWWWRGGWEKVKQHLVKNVGKALLVPIIAWSPFLVWHLVATPYAIWKDADTKATKAEQERQAGINEREQLKQQVSAKDSTVASLQRQIEKCASSAPVRLI